MAISAWMSTTAGEGGVRAWQARLDTTHSVAVGALTSRHADPTALDPPRCAFLACLEMRLARGGSLTSRHPKATTRRTRTTRAPL